MHFLSILQTSGFWNSFTNISTPLALAGLFAAIIFLIARQVLRNFRPAAPGARHSYELARSILKYLFILSLVGMLLGTVGFLATLLYPKAQPPPSDGLSSAEREASRLQDEVMILKSSWENTEQSPADQTKVVEQGPRLAQQLLTITDSDLRPAWRVLKYEYTLYAYTMAASEAPAGTQQEKQTKVDYADKGLQAARMALNLIADIKRNYTTSEDYKKAMNYLQKEEVEDRINYLGAICLCRKADVSGDEALKQQAGELIAKISPSYLSKYPVERNTELKQCIVGGEAPR